MRREDVIQIVTAGGAAALVAVPSILLTAASLSLTFLMAGAFGIAFVMFAMAFGPLFGIIFGTSLIALVATAVTGLSGAPIMTSCFALYGPYITLFILAIVGNAVEFAVARLRSSAAKDVTN